MNARNDSGASAGPAEIMFQPTDVPNSRAYRLDELHLLAAQRGAYSDPGVDFGASLRATRPGERASDFALGMLCGGALTAGVAALAYIFIT